VIRLTAVIDLDGHAPKALTREFTTRNVTLGRDASADFQIPLSTISRQHARIIEADGIYVVEDLGSTHGTLVNGRRIGKGDKKVLKDGDIIELTRAKVTCNIENGQVALPVTGENTQAIAANAVKGILKSMGDAKSEGPYLRVLNGADEGVRFSFAGTLTEWSLGRSKECEFILNDPNVSRKHAQVKKDWNGFTIYDLGSKNGVQIADKTIKKPRRLHDRDEITIGPVKLVFVDPDAALLDALKDVPGFGQDEPVEADELTSEPSHLGAPAGQGGADEGAAGISGENGAGSQELGLGQDGMALEPMPEPSMPTYENIDPDLLATERVSSPMEWLFLGLGGVVLLVIVGVLLYLFV